MTLYLHLDKALAILVLEWKNSFIPLSLLLEISSFNGSLLHI